MHIEHPILHLMQLLLTCTKPSAQLSHTIMLEGLQYEQPFPHFAHTVCPNILTKPRSHPPWSHLPAPSSMQVRQFSEQPTQNPLLTAKPEAQARQRDLPMEQLKQLESWQGKQESSTRANPGRQFEQLLEL